MGNDNKKIIIYATIGIVIALIAIIILLFMIFKPKGQSFNILPTYSSAEKAQIDKQHEMVVENDIIQSYNVKDVKEKEKSFKNFKYDQYAKYQFKEIEPGEEYVSLALEDGIVVDIKLFPKIAPKAVAEFKEAVQSGKLQDIELIYGVNETLSTNSTSKIFSEGFNSEINYALVPYKGALVASEIKGADGKELYGNLDIILKGLSKDDEKYLKGQIRNESLTKEAKKRGASLFHTYTKDPVFGQIVKGLDELERYIVENAGRTKQGDQLPAIRIQNAKITKK